MKTFAALSFLILAQDLVEPKIFNEFYHPTISFKKVHLIKKGERICKDHEFPDEVPFGMRNCYETSRNTKVRVMYVIHGITEPQFFVEPLDPLLKSGWVYRSSIDD